ncbi:MAG: ArsR/SmtB family transcription factor [Spirochaeta sp.]
MKMSESDFLRADARAAVLKALAHPTRIYIVDVIEREGRHCVCDLTDRVGADTSTISRHLSVLKNAGILQASKEGTTVYYDLACGCIADFMSGLEKVLRSKQEQNSRRLSAALSIG